MGCGTVAAPYEMTPSLSDIPTSALSSHSAQQAVHLFRLLLWCSARRRSLPLGSITISDRIDVADGGIDAAVAKNAVTSQDDLLAAGNSFYQIKAGTSAAPWQAAWSRNELFSSQRPSKNALGEAVRHCMGRKGRYVLVCFGVDPTDAQRRRAVRNLRDNLAACGYRNPRVDVWGQSTLLSLIHEFPSIGLRLTDRQHLPFLTFEEWKRDAELRHPLQLGEEQKEVIERIRTDLRGDEKRHVRMVGEPGLGKTRLALEALSADDLAPTVVYVRHPEDFERSPLFNVVIRADDISSLTLVIDDCPPKERASVWNVLRQRSDRIRLVTMDHGPDPSADEMMDLIECPSLATDQIKAILSEYVGDIWGLDRWARFCSGSPRVAHAVGANLKRNPDDALKEPASVPIWERFIRGNSSIASLDQAQMETVLRYVSLFQKFGFEPPVGGEARFVAELAQEADPAITWPKFQSIIKHYRDRRILQGKTTLFLVPWLLHVHLWLQFWEHYGTGTDVAALLSRMPDSLFRWFTAMFKYGHASPKCVAQIQRLTSKDGPFDDPRFITSGPGAAFLNELAEADPEATLRCIERTIGQWSPTELERFKEKRQQIVWALEKIAVWKNLFHRAATILLKLALAENASYSNNATGTFCGLFSMGFGIFSSTEAPPDMRLPVLRTGLEAKDPRTRSLALKALRQALDRHPHSKSSGPEHQGLRPLPKLWHPRTWAEVHEAYRTAWRLMYEHWQRSEGQDKAHAAEVMIDAAFFLLQNDWISEEIISSLNSLVSDANTDLRLIIALVARFRRLKWRSLNGRAASGLRTLEKRIEGDSVASKIRRMVLLGTWDDIDAPKGGPYGSKHTAKLRSLARAALRKPSLLRDLLPELLTREGFGLFAFGRAFAEEDTGFRQWDGLLRRFADGGNRRNAQFLAGYLAGMFSRDEARWETCALQCLRDDVLRMYARDLVAGTGLNERILNKVCVEVERGVIPVATLDRMRYVGAWSGLPFQRFIQFLEWCLSRNAPDLVQLAIEAAHSFFRVQKGPPPIPEQPLLDLLTHPNALDLSDGRSVDHYWSDLTARFVEVYPEHAMRLFGSVIDRLRTWEPALALRHSQAQGLTLDLMRRDPHESWSIIAAGLNSTDDDRAQALIFWLGSGPSFGKEADVGPMVLLPAEDILAWVDHDPAERAPMIARECPKTLSPTEGGELTRELLVHYGHLEYVRGALSANFGTDGWSGRASDHLRKKRDRFREWLVNERAPQVISWLEHEIEVLGHDVHHHEIREEREF